MFEVFNESVVQQENFQRIANKLLNECFLLKKREDTKKDYHFVKQNLDVFTAVFNVLGYDIKIDEDYGVIGIINRYNKGRLNLTMYQSIFLLILSTLYIEKRKDLSYSSDEVVVLMEDIRAKYDAMKIKKKPHMDKGMEREFIKLFRRYNIIQNLDSDIIMSDTRIVIYPSIFMAVTTEDINHAYQEIESKLKKHMEYQASFITPDSDAEPQDDREE